MATTTFFVHRAEPFFASTEPVRFTTLEAALAELYRSRVDVTMVALHAEISGKRIVIMGAADQWPRQEAIVELVRAQEDADQAEAERLAAAGAFDKA